MTASSSERQLCFFSLFEKFIKASKTGKRLQPNGKRISAGTIANYDFTLKLLREFAAQKQFKMRIRPIRFLSQRAIVTEGNYWKKFYKKLLDYLYKDRNCYDNYAGQNIKIIKTFLNYLNKDLLLGIGDFHKSFYVRWEEISIFPLTPEQLNFLIRNKVFEMSLSKRMRQVKDFFVFGCTVGLRVSDLFSLRASNLKFHEGKLFLSKRSAKTGMETTIRLPDFAVEIIARYKNKGKSLLPMFSLSNLNKYIKRLLELAGFDYPVGKTRDKMGKAAEISPVIGSQTKSWRFCDLASSHSMRRTAITTMLSLGMPEQLVRKISGHKPSSREFYRYVSWSQAYQDQETEKMYEKLEQLRSSR